MECENIDCEGAEIETEKPHSSNTALGDSNYNKKHSGRLKKLLEKVEKCMNTFDYKSAIKHCQRVLNLDPNNVEAIELQAGIYLESGDTETAKNLWLHAVELSPDDGHSKYFSLGQLNEAKEALKFYNKGVSLVQEKLRLMPASDQKEQKMLQKELSNAFCAMAEIFMTDCCFEEDAEIQCKNLIEKSIEADTSNPEAYVCLANFLIVQGKMQEAKEAMIKSLSWLPAYQASREGRSEEDDPLEICPLSYDSRINTSKLLIELEMYDEATEILGGLTEEDDEVVECWYLLGWLNYLQGKDYFGNARFYFHKALKVAKKTQFDDTSMLSHIEELCQEVGPESNESDSSGEDDDGKENEMEDDENFETDEEMQ